MPSLMDIGLKLTHAPAKFERVRDIEVFEGPLITEFKANERDTFLFVWRDKDSTYNRWLGFPVRSRDIALFEQRIVSLHQLIERAAFWYLTDVDSRGHFKRWFMAALEQLPDDYVPEKDSFFDPNLRPSAKQSEHGQRVLIEGQWGLSEIIEYPRRYLDVYSVQYCLAPGAAQRVRENAFKWRFASGYVYHNFFQNLAKSIPKQDQAKVQALQYSSPGMMEFSLNEDVATLVLSTVRRLQSQMESTKEIYDEIHLWLKSKKGGKIAKKKEASVPSDRAAAGELKEFCSVLGALDYERLRELTDNDQLNTAEIVLSYYRRLRVLARYELDRKAVIVSVDNPIDSKLLNPEQASKPDDESSDEDDYDLDPDDV